MPTRTADRSPLVRPDPAPAERKALEHALAEARKRAGTPVRSAWWRVGVHENAGDASPHPRV